MLPCANTLSTKIVSFFPLRPFGSGAEKPTVFFFFAFFTDLFPPKAIGSGGKTSVKTRKFLRWRSSVKNRPIFYAHFTSVKILTYVDTYTKYRNMHILLSLLLKYYAVLVLVLYTIYKYAKS